MGQYKEIAKSYASGERMKHPTRRMVYKRLLDLCQSVSNGLDGKKVCDIGAGAGDSSRLLATAGAQVYGIEPEMELLKLAVAKERENRHGISYSNGKLPYKMPPLRDGLYELITGSFLLHYAESKEELSDMLKEIFRLLKPGGHFVGIILDPQHPITELNLELVQHVTSWVDEPWVEGSKVKAELVGVDGSIGPSGGIRTLTERPSETLVSLMSSGPGSNTQKKKDRKDGNWSKKT